MTTERRARVRNGDPDAFAELFDECARAVYNHAFRLTADWATAEDVMATTFMEAWRRRDTVDAEGGTLRPWLLGIATNVARSHHRSDRRYRAAASAAAAAMKDVEDHAEAIAGRVDDRRTLQATLTALSLLKRPEREVLTLCLHEGMAYAEAARVLDVPVGTVRSRLSRARGKLRRLTDAQLIREQREPTPAYRQIQDDRGYAVRSAQEGNR